MGKLDGKVAIVTGGASGMGQTTAVLFAKEGAKVVVADYVVESGEETTRMIKEAGGEAIFVKTDVSKASDVAAMVKTAVDTYGKLDILFNCAGLVEREAVPLHECKEEDFDKVIAVNLKGVFLGMKYAIPEMIKTGGGSIINQGSLVCVQGFPGLCSYSASKGGVATISMAAAVDYLRQNIRVNWTEPGLIATPMVRLGLLKGNKKALEELEASQPLGRFGTEEEIANLVLFLASDDASYITATGVKIDGALSQHIHLR
jgi:NAD(P)-dependent dehydrogenase (short-subunit alcohol dehydrogenase family)